MASSALLPSIASSGDSPGGTVSSWWKRRKAASTRIRPKAPYRQKAGRRSGADGTWVRWVGLDFFGGISSERVRCKRVTAPVLDHSVFEPDRRASLTRGRILSAKMLTYVQRSEGNPIDPRLELVCDRKSHDLFLFGG